jgi:simple sugar transport system permease protein
MGAIFGGVVGYLKAKFGIHEVIVSIMFNWIAFYFCNYIANSTIFHKAGNSASYPINPSGITLLFSNWKFSENGRAFLKNNKFWQEILLKTDLNISFLVAAAMAIIVWLVLYKTKKGYEFRAIGANPSAAKYAGINVGRNIVYSMLISGAISGLAGALTITGVPFHNLQVLAAFENNGFNGLSVALIAGGSPISCIFSGFLLSGLNYAGQTLQFKTNVPSEIINVMIGIIVFYTAIAQYFPYLAEKFLNKGGKDVK